MPAQGGSAQACLSSSCCLPLPAAIATTAGTAGRHHPEHGWWVQACGLRGEGAWHGKGLCPVTARESASQWALKEDAKYVEPWVCCPHLPTAPSVLLGTPLAPTSSAPKAGHVCC